MWINFYLCRLFSFVNFVLIVIYLYVTPSFRYSFYSHAYVSSLIREINLDFAFRGLGRWVSWMC